ncbi:helix-turn-helix transcriptional regulator [Paramicrobacterium agarici]|uniref:helix-turn-helix transcriptional regulator n=1 Tax=Paramicrobacterium agarici TaxID=630514 RepID=UPI0011545D37|nr:helix-turn-helix transcriptional regulator [Microbacterium agarici]TQO22583.1 helix-turn-helix protein [Microbacterium agarici]
MLEDAAGATRPAEGAQRRRELGAFLRARRTQLSRSEVGLPPRTRGGDVGLRREEVSYLSGVSVTWYTWLEQGRDINPSRQVVDAVARTLRLETSAHEYVLALLGYSTPLPQHAAPVPQAPAHLQRLLDSWNDPAFALAPDWGMLAWNDAYERLYPGIATVDDEHRNLLWLVFTDPYVRELLPDWQATSRRFLSEFRAETGPRLGDPAHGVLVERLSAASAEFRAGWESRDVQRFASRERLFQHPDVGLLHLEHHQLALSDHPEIHVVVYTAMPETDAAERLARLRAP